MSEKATVEPTERSTKNQESVPSKTQYICSVCGKLVVPTKVTTVRGTRYHCPKCKRFMKPLNPEEVKQRTAKENNNRQKE